MGRKQQTEEQTAAADQAEGTPTPPPNGDSKPAKKPPRDKAAAFKRVGNQRIKKAMYAMQRLIPLANRNAYTYTDDQAAKICHVVETLAEEVLQAFINKASPNEPQAEIL